MTALRIGCLAWGSLLWDPRSLPRAGGFREDGPALPIEFSRVSTDGRVTLVIDPGAPDIETFWVPLAVGSLDEAVARLGARERVAPARWPSWIGRRLKSDPSRSPGGDVGEVVARIDRWLARSDLDAVVWTALPSRLPDGRPGRPGVDALVAHLEGLEGAARRRAEEYIRRAPTRLRTPNRLHFEARLGWLAVASDPGRP